MYTLTKKYNVIDHTIYSDKMIFSLPFREILKILERSLRARVRRERGWKGHKIEEWADNIVEASWGQTRMVIGVGGWGRIKKVTPSPFTTWLVSFCPRTFFSLTHPWLGSLFFTLFIISFVHLFWDRERNWFHHWIKSFDWFPVKLSIVCVHVLTTYKRFNWSKDNSWRCIRMTNESNRNIQSLLFH